MTAKITTPPIEYARQRSEPEPNTGCWLWTGPTRGRFGYAALGGNKYLCREILGITDPNLRACHLKGQCLRCDEKVKADKQLDVKQDHAQG